MWGWFSMSAQTLLSVGDKWYSYSGIIFGDVSAPASISMILIPNTGLKDSYVKVEPYYGKLITGSPAQALGFEVKLNDVTILKDMSSNQADQIINRAVSHYDLFIPRQSKLEVISNNTADNNTQERGVNLIGYYL